MQVKTITTAAGVNEIDFGNDSSQSTAHFYWLKNLGDSTLYVSANPNPVAEKDDVAELPAKGAVSVETDEGKIYVLGAGKVEIHRTNSKFCPFDWQSSGSGGGGGGSITVDSELSDTSTNPLQNKVTTAAINEVKSAVETKSDINHIHDISASGNPVQMDNLQDGVPFSEMVVSGKNLIVPKSVSRSVNGIDFTVNSDKSITINGASTSGTSFMIGSAVLNKNEKYTLSILSESKGINIHIGSGDDFSNPYDYTTTAKTITALSEDNTIWLWVPADRTLDNVIIYPQLELGETATAYDPPITGRGLTVSASGKNLIPYPYYGGDSKTLNGVTFTVNADGSVTVNGTATANTNLWLYPYGKDYMHLNEDVSYFLSGNCCTSGEITISLGFYSGSTWIKAENDKGNGKSFQISHSANYDSIGLSIFVEKNAVCDYITVYPQLELGTTATPYEPYHGASYTITPDTNPYTIPDGIRQQDGLNVVSVSEGELSVVGVQKNAAIKRIWDDMGMDLLFDGTVTANTNCITENVNGYNFLYFYGNLSSVSGESGNVTGSLVIPKTARAISAGQSLVVTTGVTYITVNIINIESGVITFTVTPNDSSKEIYEFKIYGIK